MGEKVQKVWLRYSYSFSSYYTQKREWGLKIAPPPVMRVVNPIGKFDFYEDKNGYLGWLPSATPMKYKKLHPWSSPKYALLLVFFSCYVSEIIFVLPIFPIMPTLHLPGHLVVPVIPLHYSQPSFLLPFFYIIFYRLLPAFLSSSFPHLSPLFRIPSS